MILNGVVGAAFKHFCNFCPLIVHDTVHEEQNPFFFFIPIALFNAWVQMIMPTFTALFADATIQMLRDQGPLLRTVCHNKLENTPVLLCCPGSFYIEWLTLTTYPFLGKYSVGVGNILIGRRNSLARLLTTLLMP